ncbi:hypothetical protein PPUN109347_14110 [Pseudomonas putida]|nr:hypothetical protein PPUN109347_14110 [Pseudomonas putida]
MWERPCVAKGAQGAPGNPEGYAMAKTRNNPTASPPPTLGEGCLARYDPEALADTDGTDFPGAAELWQQLNPPDAASAPAAGAPAGTRTLAHPPADKSSK